MNNHNLAIFSWNFATLHELVLHYSISSSDFLLCLCVAILLGAFPIILHVNKAMSTLHEIKSSLYILWFNLLWNINVNDCFVFYLGQLIRVWVESKEAPWTCMTLEYDNQLQSIRPKSLSCSTNALIFFHLLGRLVKFHMILAILKSGLLSQLPSLRPDTLNIFVSTFLRTTYLRALSNARYCISLC